MKFVLGRVENIVENEKVLVTAFLPFSITFLKFLFQIPNQMIL